MEEKWEIEALPQEPQSAEKFVSEEKKLRFRIRRGDLEVELEGDFDYVREQYEKFSEKLDVQPLQPAQTSAMSSPDNPLTQDPLEGILQFSSEGRPHLTVPADSLSAREAVAPTSTFH